MLIRSGSVHETGGGVYGVRLEGGSCVEATLRGRLKQVPGEVVIGDRVTVAETRGAWTIESVEPRGTTLVRRGRGGRAPKVLAANLDRVFVVVSLAEPPATTELIDRLLVLVEASGIHPILLTNKLDLPGAHEVAAELSSTYQGIGYLVLGASARSGEGLELLRDELCRGTSALIGPSGVGKSSLLNALDRGLALRTGELSVKTGTGKHTTSSSRLIELECGGRVADTPGFGDVGLWGVAAEDLASCFPELAALDPCRFRGCAHLQEPDCAVRAAVEAGRIRESRYRSYRKLHGEAAAAR
ncbi:MAG: ribosome small subunit-dependent GTPase A [Gemmatimonadetes bacterium]|nr:ribosome small subunit-dependent GTPase A [Gemmatimonadota bacterium]